MGMGNYPNHADCVTQKFVMGEVPAKMEKFNASLASANFSFDEFCDLVFNHESEEVPDNIISAFDELKQEFDEETELDLYVVYHNAEDRGDELDGGSFAVGKVYDLTPAGKAYNDEITRKMWSVFG